MKRINFTTLLLSCYFITLSAQQEVKKYVLVEHFSNTVCDPCAVFNPPMFEMLENFEGDYHHISYHPPVPWTSCIFYQHNTIDNATRAIEYNIPGTPIVALAGTLLGGSNGFILPQEKFEEQLNLTSPLQVLVEETGGQDRQATVTIKTVGNLPAQDLRLYVTLVEKTVDYNAPNGETIHHNVLRDIISKAEGDPFTAAATGQEVVMTFDYSIDNEWIAEEIYVIAFVQNPFTLEVLNSGSRFDDNTVGLKPLLKASLTLFPNPARDILKIDLSPFDFYSSQLEVYNVAGNLLISKQIQEARPEVAIHSLPEGVYLLKIETPGGVLSGRFIRTH